MQNHLERHKPQTEIHPLQRDLTTKREAIRSKSGGERKREGGGRISQLANASEIPHSQLSPRIPAFFFFFPHVAR